MSPSTDLLFVIGAIATLGCSSSEVPTRELVAQPTLLSQTGLYSDISSKQLASDLKEFTPSNRLWSDGLTKTRWVRLPPGTQIDTSDMDNWQFPVGTQFFKEFSLNGQKLETRLIQRNYATGDPDVDFFVGAFVWRADQSEADYAVDGVSAALGTFHDVPSVQQCWGCHEGSAGHILGFSAVQLSDPSATAGGPTVSSLASEGVLSNPPNVSYAIPGNPVVANALGYLHANCGHCHNPTGIAYPDTSIDLKLRVGITDPTMTPTYMTTLGVPLDRFSLDTLNPGFTTRIVPGNPQASELLYRMGQRGNHAQMPPLATIYPDPTGIDVITTWIQSL